MSGRRHLIAAVLGCAAALPIIIGASCPPPTTPFYLAVTSSNLDVGAQVPSCVPGRVCISVVNTAYVNVEVSLYVHDGFDPLIQYPAGVAFACCPNPDTALAPCPCPRSGYQVGEIQLNRPELFSAVNLEPIQGFNVRLLQPRESLLLQFQEGDIKSFGLAAAMPGLLPAAPEVRDGPRYRCTMVPIPAVVGLPGSQARAQEDVPSGETFQFVVYDQSGGALPGLAQLATRTGTSAAGGCPPMQ